MIAVSVQAHDFDPGRQSAGLSGANVGGVVTFVGYVRDTAAPHTDAPHTAARLDYMDIEHYPAMTERAITALAHDAKARWTLAGVMVIHRFGRLRPGERIVMVATAAPHRASAFEGAEFMMDYLKTRAPFWKKETTGNTAHWVCARPEDDARARRW